MLKVNDASNQRVSIETGSYYWLNDRRIDQADWLIDWKDLMSLKHPKIYASLH